MPETVALLREERFYSKLELFLGDINRQVVRLDGESKRLCVKITMGVVTKLIERLKNEDPTFKYLYNKIAYVGSFYDGLRVSEATEFDINVILKLPCNYEKIKIENSNVNGGFVCLNVKNAVFDEAKLSILPCAKEWKKWIDTDGYLLHLPILKWWESILTKISDKGKYSIEFEKKIYEVLRFKNGPANTLRIKEGNFTIDVDLVPVIEFPSSLPPPPQTRWREIPPRFLTGSWVVVPKPMDDRKLWRLSFPVQEQLLMLDLRHLKYVNRLLKKFRDENNLKISSYYIKTFFISEAFEKRQNNNEDFWKKPISYLFVYMLVKVANALENKQLPFFWNQKMNLFSAPLDKREKHNKLLENMEGYVKRVIMNINKYIENNDIIRLKPYIYQLFGVKEITTEGIPDEIEEEPEPEINQAQSRGCIIN